MKIAIGAESMNVKDEDWAWVIELNEISREGRIGDFARRIWTDTDREKVKLWWKASPLWFRKAAGPILGGKFTPKTKPKNLDPMQIMDALEHFSKNGLDNPLPTKVD
jgi:hypothetical protein